MVPTDDEPLSEMVAVAVRPDPFVLQPPYDQAGMYAQFSGEFDHVGNGCQFAQAGVVVRWYEQVPRERVGLVLRRTRVARATVMDIDATPRLVQNMPRFMKKGEPEYVTPLITIAQLDERPFGS